MVNSHTLIVQFSGRRFLDTQVAKVPLALYCVTICLIAMTFDMAQRAMGSDRSPESEYVLNDLKQNLETPLRGKCVISVKKEFNDLTAIRNSLGRAAENTVAKSSDEMTITYIFDYSSHDIGRLRMDTKQGNKVSTFLRTPDYSLSKIWINGKSAHTLTKQLPNAPPVGVHNVFDIRCIGMATFTNLWSNEFTFEKMWDLVSGDRTEIEKDGENLWILHWRPMNGSVQKRIWLDGNLGMSPIKLTMCLGESSIPFATVETRWERRAKCVIPTESINWTPELTWTMRFDWQLVDDLPEPSPFEIEDLNITDRTLVVDRRLNAPIVQSILNDERRPNSHALVGREFGTLRTVLCISTVFVIIVLLILILRRRMLHNS